MGSIPPLLGKLADIRMSSQYGAVYAMSDTGTNLGYFLGKIPFIDHLLENDHYFLDVVSKNYKVTIMNLTNSQIKQIIPPDYPCKHISSINVK